MSTSTASKKSIGFTALKNAAICVVVSILLLAVLAIPVHSGALDTGYILPFVLVILGLCTLIAASRTAKAATSRKMPFALLCGCISLVFLVVAGAVFFRSFSFAGDFSAVCGAVGAGTLAGGALASRKKRHRKF